MKAIRISIFALATFSFLTSSAQFEAKVSLGQNISNVSTSGIFDNIESLKSPKTGHHVQALGVYNINENWSTELGISYREKGFRLEQNQNVKVLGISIPVGISTELDIKAIDIPVRLKYTIPTPYAKVYAIAGGGMSFNTEANINSSGHFIGDIDIAQTPVSQFTNNNELYGTIGLGISRDVGKGAMFFETAYSKSFSNYTSDLLLDIPLRNKGITVGVGYTMPI